MKTPVRYLLFALLVLPVTGCKVDSEYDFSKLDTTMTLLKGVEFPVPDAQLLLKDVFALDRSEFITCEENGDYLIDLKLDPIALQVLIPDTDQDRLPVDFVSVAYAFDAVPDFLSGENQSVVVDLSDMQVALGVNSDIPAEFSINTTIEAVRSGAVAQRCPIDNLSFSYGSSQYVFLEEKASSDPDYYRAVPGLGKLFSPIPDTLKISSLDVYADAAQRALVAHDQVYNLSCQVSAQSPIRFAEGTHFQMSTPLRAELDLDQIGLKKAVLSLKIENSMPLDLSFSLEAFDAAGNRLETIQVAPDFEKISALGRTEGTITLSTDGDLRFSSLLLGFTASAPSSGLSGTCLNRYQGLKLTDMSLSLPDGVQVKLGQSEKQ